MPDPERYNVIVWSAQECERNKAENWIKKMTDYLGDSFHPVGKVDMWEMFMVAYVHKRDILRCNSVETNLLALGVMNIIGNKGALIIKFNLYDRSFLFLNCHLVAGAWKGTQRCDMMSDALKGINVQKVHERFEPDAVSDVNVLMGDMNMRFKARFTDFIEFVEFAKDHLYSYDELYEHRHEHGRFPGYHEEPIDFMPTYKRHSKNNDVYINKNEQCPSFTDRIVLKQNDKNSKITYNEYTSRDNIFGSDHRPVFLDFTVELSPEEMVESSLLLNP
jgi:hypothetical protein